jgi:hypothetical protein
MSPFSFIFKQYASLPLSTADLTGRVVIVTGPAPSSKVG